jgi:hypothetical protein
LQRLHPAKGKLLAGQAARGSGALSSFVDIILEMSWFTRATGQDRLRRLRAFSSHSDTPRHLVVELTADANDYIAHTQVDEEDFDDDWQGALAVLQGMNPIKKGMAIRIGVLLQSCREP